MTVNSLSLEGFRNYKKEFIEFGECINIITGLNAQGKTNILEAIYYLTSAKSFRPASDKEIINFECENAIIRADIVSGNRNQQLEARIFRGQRRQLSANDVKLKKVGELAEKLAVVVFNPDDLSLVRDGAAIRRKFLDNALSQLRPGYAAILQEFNKLYEHKTRILRDHYEKPSLLELLDDFNQRLAEKSAQLIFYRSAYISSMANRASLIHKEFSDGKEKLEIRYKTIGGMDAQGRKPSELLPDILEHQRNHFEAELRSGLCLTGAHKDDLEVEINNAPARRFASQGQARSVCVSMKLAERDILSEDRGEEPILLLDDVLSELDYKRRMFVLGKIVTGQVFITCCDNAATSEYPRGTVIIVENGKCKVNSVM